MKNLFIFLMIIGFSNVSFASNKIIEAMDNCDFPPGLDCYASLQKKYGKIPPRGLWKLETKIFPDGSKEIYLSLKANNPIIANSKPYTPNLVLRCKENNTEMYILTGIAPYIDKGPHGATVYLGFDHEKTKRYLFTKSTNDQALFAPDAIKLIRKILKKQTMQFQFTPFHTFPTTINFNVTGLDKVIDELEKECHWQ